MNDYYMYSHSSRFTGSLTGQPQHNSRFGMPFEMNTSAQHKQFHEMKAEMPSDVLELFKANDIAFLRAPVKPKCRPLDPVTTTCKDIDAMFDIPNENLMEKEPGENKEQKRKRVAAERRDRCNNRILQEIEEWNPFADEKISSDPEKTLIVARLNYKTTEKSLKFEFEVDMQSPRSMASSSLSASSVIWREIRVDTDSSNSTAEKTSSRPTNQPTTAR